MIDLSAITVPKGLPPLILPDAVSVTRTGMSAIWRQARLQCIGASDVPRVLGLSPYGGPWSVFASKVLPEARRETAQQRRGHRWEARVLEDHHDLTGLPHVGPLGHMCIGGPVSWLTVTPDAFVLNRPTWEVGEAKTDTSEIGRWAWGESGQSFETWEQARGQVREDYAAQLYAQLWATGLEWGRLIVMRSLDDLRWFRLRRDPTIIEWMRPRLEAFWQILEARRGGADVYPEIDEDLACATALARLLPEGSRSLVAATPADIASVNAIAADEALLSAIDARVRTAKGRLAERITRAGAYGIDLGGGEKVLYQRGSGESRFIRIYRRS